MPDIFGRERQDYEHIRAMDENYGEDVWNRHHESGARHLRSETPRNPDFRPHDFDTLGRGALDDVTRAPEDATALGFITNTGLQILTMIDEIYYTANRLNNFVATNTSISDGAQSYGVRIVDIVGKMDRIATPGQDAPTATVSRTLATADLHYYGVKFEYSVQDLRQAVFQGIPLQTEDMRAVMAVSMDEMERVAFMGGGYPGATGLFNHSTAASPSSSQVPRVTADKNFDDMTAVEIRTLINNQLSDVISDSREQVGRQPALMSGMTVYLPQKQYDSLTNLYIGDNAEKTLMRSIKEDNPWSHFSGQPLMIERVLELDSIVTTAVGGSNARMVVGLKNTNVAEMGIAFQPRLLRLSEEGMGVVGRIEARFGEVWIKRPGTMRYVDGI